MDLGPRSFSACFMMVCLLGVARCPNGDNDSCPCTQIPQLPLTKPPPETCVLERYRYQCIDGYVRKVGTSTLVKCKMGQWMKPSLECIPNPLRTTTQRPESTVTNGHSNSPQTFSITTTIRPTSTSLHMTQSGGTSAFVATETNGTEPTSHGAHSDHEHEGDFTTDTTATDRTSSSATTTTTTTPLNESPAVASSQRLQTTTRAVIICASLVIMFTVIGIAFLCHRRRLGNHSPKGTEEEQMSMNHVSSAPA